MRFEKITIDPEIQNGQPCVRDTRVTVRRVLEIMADYPDRDQLFYEHPELGEEDMREALRYAAALLDPCLWPEGYGHGAAGIG